MFAIYTFMLTAALILGGPYFLFKALTLKKWRQGFWQRLGFFIPPTQFPYIWLHAASVGEVKIAVRLLRGLVLLFPNHHFVITVMTEAGFTTARKTVPEEITVLYAPLDVPFVVKRFLWKLKPTFLGLIETELWPHLIVRTHKSGAVVGILNGRISDKSFPRYRGWRGLFRTVLAAVDFACVQTDEDKSRFMELGLASEKIGVCSSIKYDLLFDRDAPTEDIQAEFGLAKESIVVTAGSTRDGEEELLLPVFEELRKKYPYLVSIIAPRHIERTDEIRKLLERNHVPYRLKTQPYSSPPLSSGYLILDQLGELWKAYAISTAVFVGGSLVDFGGQNILEPVSMGKPVVFGPYMENFKEIAQYLLEKNGAIQIRNTAELTVTLQRLLASPAERAALGKRGENSLAQKRGALQKNIAEIKKYVSIR